MKTAVEWLLNEQHLLNIDDSLTKKQYLGKRRKIEREALEMEKEQIIESYCDGFVKGSEGGRIMSEEYYNKTYVKA
jgi:hypothetical protein